MSKKKIINGFIRASKSNLKGKRIKEKLVIIESDDWGAIRTPSKQALKAFEEGGLDLANSKYKVDALTSKEDLEMLFEVLMAFKGSNDQPVKFTANSIMANPNFEKIKEAQFTEYFYEEFTETFQRYPQHQNNLRIWKQGMHENVFQPQFHGREHLNYTRWLDVLRNGNENALYCFDWGATYSGVGDYSFMEAFDWNSPDEMEQQKEIFEKGIQIFEKSFGFSSNSFIAPCYVWDPKLEETMAQQNVKWIQGTRSQKIPMGSFGNYQSKAHSFGEQNKYGIKYNIRNCFFEPSLSMNDQVDDCLGRIANAFLFGKPAVISSHRINYVGYIDPSNRDRGLRELSRLLKTIIKKWPEVKFISTDQLDEYIQ